MTDNEIIKALEYRLKVGGGTRIDKEVFDLINRLQRENEKNENIIRLADKTIATQEAELDKKDTEIDILIRKKECLRDEISGLKAEIERLKEENKHFMEEYKKANEALLGSVILKSEIKAEAVKEFAERLCEGRVSNDPVVIAVKVELKWWASRERKMRRNEKDNSIYKRYY